MENRLRKIELTVAPQKTTKKQKTRDITTPLQCNIDNASLEWPKTDNASVMTVSMTSSTESSASSVKVGVFPLFEPEKFANSANGTRTKMGGGRNSAKARFIKGERKVIKVLIMSPQTKYL